HEHDSDGWGIVSMPGRQRALGRICANLVSTAPGDAELARNVRNSQTSVPELRAAAQGCQPRPPAIPAVKYRFRRRPGNGIRSTQNDMGRIGMIDRTLGAARVLSALRGLVVSARCETKCT